MCYEAMNALLLNEFLKAHRKLEDQQATIAQQQKEIKALTAGFKAPVARALRSRCRIQRKHDPGLKSLAPRICGSKTATRLVSSGNFLSSRWIWPRPVLCTCAETDPLSVPGEVAEVSMKLSYPSVSLGRRRPTLNRHDGCSHERSTKACSLKSFGPAPASRSMKAR